MDKILSDFGVQPVLLVAQIVNFFILLFLLKKLLYGPILNVLEKRKETIAQSLKNAQEIEKRLQKVEEDREKKIEEAAKEARFILDEAAASANQIIDSAHQKATKDIEDMMEKGKQSIALEKDKMQNALRQELSDIVIVALHKVIGKTIDTKDHKKMVEDALKQI